METFEFLDGPKTTNPRAVQLTLQKIERFQKLDNQPKIKKLGKSGKKND